MDHRDDFIQPVCYASRRNWGPEKRQDLNAGLSALSDCWLSDPRVPRSHKGIWRLMLYWRLTCLLISSLSFHLCKVDREGQVGHKGMGFSLGLLSWAVGAPAGKGPSLALESDWPLDCWQWPWRIKSNLFALPFRGHSNSYLGGFLDCSPIPRVCIVIICTHVRFDPPLWEVKIDFILLFDSFCTESSFIHPFIH